MEKDQINLQGTVLGVLPQEVSVDHISKCLKTKKIAGKLIEVPGRTFRVCHSLLKKATL